MGKRRYSAEYRYVETALQLECEFGGDRCFGVLADMDFILISTYEAEGTNPELVLYKKR